MKEKLKAKYLPVSFRQRMLDDWNNLKQGSKPVSEYIAKFDEYMSRCDVLGDEILPCPGLGQVYEKTLGMS